jgi:hypothetical protein
MSKFATGKHAKAISDRSGMLNFHIREMVKEWNGSLVHVYRVSSLSNHNLEPKPAAADGVALQQCKT